MLNVYFPGDTIPSEHPYLKFCDAEFRKFDLEDTPYNRTILQEIEQASYYDNNFFIDRLGCKLPISALSQGCKVALLIPHSSYTIDLCECGLNALQAIYRNCKDGWVYTYEPGATVHPYDGSINFEEHKIDIMVRHTHLTTLRELNDWIRRY